MASPDNPGQILDDAQQDKMIQLSKSPATASVFKMVICRTIKENADRINVLEFNKDSEDTDTSMTKESFAKKFEGIFKTDLSNAIFDAIDVNNTGSIANAAYLNWANLKPKHPRKETTQINCKWLFNTIKQMNFGQLDENSDNQVSLEEMKRFFAEKEVSDEIVLLVFSEIDSDNKGYISMKDFFQWRERFDAAKLRTWSHTLSKTMIMTGLEDFIQEMNDSDDFEMIDSNNPTDSKSNEETDDFHKVDTTSNQSALLKDILSVLDLGVDDKQQKTVELTKVIKESVEQLKYQLADARLADIKDKAKIKDTEESVQKLQYESAEQRLATKQLSKELSELMGQDVNTDNIQDLIIVIKQLQSKLSDERLQSIDLQKRTQLHEEAIARLEYTLSEARMAMTKLKRELGETLGAYQSIQTTTDDPLELTELFQKLQHQIAEERLDTIRQRRHSVQLKNNMDKINYQLADERVELMQLRENLKDLLDVDIEDMDTIDSVKYLLRKLQKRLGVEYNEDRNVLNDKSEQAQLAKADETIKKVDMEQSLANMDEEDDVGVDYADISDVDKLKKIIKQLKDELRNSRTEHLAVSGTRTHLEVQTFDLQSKLVTEKKKYTKLLRMSQNLGGFDPSMLDTKTDETDDTHDEIQDAIVDLSAAQNEYQPNSESNSDNDNFNDNDDDESDGGDSVNVNDDVDHKEDWNQKEDGRSQQEAEEVIGKLKNKIKEQYDELRKTKQENSEMTDQNSKLRSRNRNHRRRESEVFTAIGEDAKNVVETFEELEKSRQKMEDDELELEYLKAEKQRMAIAYDHVKENADKYRREATTLKGKIKDIETSRKRSQSSADKLKETREELEVLQVKQKENDSLELELAFYKAEKQRMEVKIEFTDRNQKQTKELNKQLQKAVKKEKEKVRRLSQSFDVQDIEELNALPQVQKEKEEQWKQEVDQLKDQLANEQLEKTAWQEEKKDLIKQLSNAESTQGHRDGYDEEDDGNASPLSDNGNDGDDDDIEPFNHDIDEDEDEDEEDEDDENGSGRVHDVETLKFKLAHAELQNAQLKRRVSIAGVEKEQLSLLWEQPRVTIQMVSEFIERLPLKHKEKIWARHATGQYIAKNKILHTLHSFVALCIKIKDRTAVAPSRHDIEKKLLTFANVIRERTDNANGMSLEEFNNELHYWILEPVSGLIMTNDEQKQWLDEIDMLRDELMKAQEAKRRVERKSQMDLTVLLDKMKELEQDPVVKAEELEEQIEELHAIVNELQDEVKGNETEITRLNDENVALRQGRDKARESEDDEEEEESEEEEEEEQEQAPQLIDASQQKPLSEYRDKQSEDEFAEERLEFYQNDTNVTKSAAYVGWKNQATTARKQVSDLQRERGKTDEVIGQLQQSLQELRTRKNEESTQHDSQIEQFQADIAKFKKKYQDSDRIRKDSISTLHDNLFAKLLEAEAEHEEMVADYKQQIGTLQKSNKAFEQSMATMVIAKVETINQLANTVQELRESVTLLSRECERLKNSLNVLKSKTTVQHITSSISSWIG